MSKELTTEQKLMQATQYGLLIYAGQRKINEELGKTLLMVTHDPQMASRCKRVIFLKDGYVMNDVRKEGTEEEFYRTIIGEMEKF